MYAKRVIMPLLFCAHVFLVSARIVTYAIPRRTPQDDLSSGKWFKTRYPLDSRYATTTGRVSYAPRSGTYYDVLIRIHRTSIGQTLSSRPSWNADRTSASRSPSTTRCTTESSRLPCATRQTETTRPQCFTSRCSRIETTRPPCTTRCTGTARPRCTTGRTSPPRCTTRAKCNCCTCPKIPSTVSAGCCNTEWSKSPQTPSFQNGYQTRLAKMTAPAYRTVHKMTNDGPSNMSASLLCRPTTAAVPPPNYYIKCKHNYRQSISTWWYYYGNGGSRHWYRVCVYRALLSLSTIFRNHRYLTFIIEDNQFSILLN